MNSTYEQINEENANKSNFDTFESKSDCNFNNLESESNLSTNEIMKNITQQCNIIEKEYIDKIYCDDELLSTVEKENILENCENEEDTYTPLGTLWPKNKTSYTSLNKKSKLNKDKLNQNIDKVTKKRINIDFCNCESGCSKKFCICYKNNRLCNVKCHSKTNSIVSCINKEISQQ